MSIVEELIQEALGARDELRKSALRVLQGGTSSTPPEPAGEPYLKMKDLASRLGLSVCTLWRYDVPGHELGGRRRFRMSEVVAYLESDAFKARAAELKEARRTNRENERKGN